MAPEQAHSDFAARGFLLNPSINPTSSPRNFGPPALPTVLTILVFAIMGRLEATSIDLGVDDRVRASVTEVSHLALGAIYRGRPVCSHS